MRISPDVIQSINEGAVDLSSTWAWMDSLVYSANYVEVYNQPISLEATTLDYFRFKAPVTTITIRKTSDPASEIVWSGISYNIPDLSALPPDVGNDLQQISTGVVGATAPAATYGTGTITIAAANVNLYSNATFSGAIKTYYVQGATFALTDGTEQYLVADYNGGAPVYRIENDKANINKSNVVLIRICWRQGNNVHSIDSDCQGTALANKLESALINTVPYKKSIDGGLTLGETSAPTARTVTISAAVVYAASTPHVVGAFNSSANPLTFVRHVAGVWTYSDVSVYNNTQYDNGTTTVALGSNKYGVCWFYRSIGNDVQAFFVLGTTDYPTVAQAQTAKARADLPLLLRDHCVLVGRIIVQLNAASGLVENVADTSFASGAITNHNDLSNIQGTGPEYYHLNNAQYTDLTDGGDSNLHYHAADRARANHTGTQAQSTVDSASGWITTALAGKQAAGSYALASDLANYLPLAGGAMNQNAHINIETGYIYIHQPHPGYVPSETYIAVANLYVKNGITGDSVTMYDNGIECASGDARVIATCASGDSSIIVSKTISTSYYGTSISYGEITLQSPGFLEAINASKVINWDATYSRFSSSTAPASASDSGQAGEVRFTGQYIYVCVAANTWKRVAIATW